MFMQMIVKIRRGGLATSLVLLACQAPPMVFDNTDGSPLACEHPQLSETPSRIFLADRPYTGLGISVGLGDINGDRVADLVAGQHTYALTAAEQNAGRIVAYMGSDSGLGTTPSWTVTKHDAHGFFGATLLVEDLNHDGVEDVLVGACAINFAGSPADKPGHVDVYFGAIGGPAQEASWSYQGMTVGARVGCEIASAGDVNGDGFDELLLGGLKTRVDGVLHSQVALFWGTPDGFEASPGWTITRSSPSFGFDVSNAGDVNADGFDDFLIGDHSAMHDGEQLGTVELFLGSSQGPAADSSWSSRGETERGQFGRAVAAAGDVNGDGFDDVLIGAPQHAREGMLLGKVLLYMGGAEGLDTNATWFAESDRFESPWGPVGSKGSLAAAGDVNGDGFDDVLYGAPLYFYEGESNVGATWILFGGSGTLPEGELHAHGKAGQSYFGAKVAGAADLNLDAIDDVAVTAYSLGYDGPAQESGRIKVFVGTCETGLRKHRNRL